VYAVVGLFIQHEFAPRGEVWPLGVNVVHRGELGPFGMNVHPFVHPKGIATLYYLE
jgi:hypothetical protein